MKQKKIKVEAYLHIRLKPEIAPVLDKLVLSESKRIGFKISKAALAGQLLEIGLKNRLEQ